MVEALGGDPHHPVGAVGRARSRRRRRFGARHGRPLRRGVVQHLLQRRPARVHVGLPRTVPQRHLRFTRLRHPQQQVDPFQQAIDLRLSQHDAAGLRRDEAVLERVRDVYTRRQPDNPRGAFQGVRRPHARVEVIRSGTILFETEQARHERLSLPFGLEAEQIEHRQVGAHARLRCSASPRRASSSTPTTWPFQDQTRVAHGPPAAATAGASLSADGTTR